VSRALIDDNNDLLKLYIDLYVFTSDGQTDDGTERMKDRQMVGWIDG